jgi:hypothetical protein
MIHNGYYTAERYQKMPHIAYELPLKYPLFDCIWKHLFQRKNRIPGIQSFSLESCYFPLYRASDKEVKGTFELLVGPTGLTARPL